jgi:membrane protein implicated in regulation of membrane protease activity
MHTEAFQRVTKGRMQVLPTGKAGDPREIEAIVFDPIPVNGTGYIKFQGIFWRARCFQPVSLEPGMLVKVIDRENLTLIVEPISLYAVPFQLTPQVSPYIDG